MDNQSRTIEINLAEDAEEYGALERSKISPAQVAVRSNQTFLVNNPMRSVTPITHSKWKASLLPRVRRSVLRSLAAGGSGEIEDRADSRRWRRGG